MFSASVKKTEKASGSDAAMNPAVMPFALPCPPRSPER